MFFSATDLPKCKVTIHPEKPPDDNTSPARRPDHFLLCSSWFCGQLYSGGKEGREGQKEKGGGEKPVTISNMGGGGIETACEPVLITVWNSSCCSAHVSGFWALKRVFTLC